MLARNWRGEGGEIDLLCRRGDTVVICEVKARSSLAFGHPWEAVGPAKRRRLRRLTAQWLASNGVRTTAVRFDVAGVLDGMVEVVEGAF